MKLELEITTENQSEAGASLMEVAQMLLNEEAFEAGEIFDPRKDAIGSYAITG